MSVKDEGTMINGYKVLFPQDRKPFSPQLAVISKVLIALKSNENALLESPTGTGKTLALLTSTLSWQSSYIEKRKKEIELRQSKNIEDTNENINQTSVEKSKEDRSSIKEKKLPLTRVPTVIFCSRTHSQLQQVITELKSCHPTYIDNITMSILGSRAHLCINDELKSNDNNKSSNKKYNSNVKSLDDNCRELNKTFSCHYNHKNTVIPLVKQMINSKNNYSSNNDNNSKNDNNNNTNINNNNNKNNSIWDIEDIIIKGKESKACPYYASRAVAEKANYIFAPYNYILNPNIRKSSGINLKDSVIIFDEAHNIEDVCRDSASLELTQTLFVNIIKQLKKMSITGSIPCKALLQFLVMIHDWIVNNIDDDKISFKAHNNDNNNLKHSQVPLSIQTLSTQHHNYSSTATQKNKNNLNYNNINNNYNANDNIWEGLELLEIFEDRIGLTCDTLAVYQQHFDNLVATQEDMFAIFQKFDTNDNDSFIHQDHINLEYDDSLLTHQIQNNNNNKSNQANELLSSSTLLIIRNILNVFYYMFKNNKSHANDFYIVIETNKSSYLSSSSEWIFNIWCMNPSIIFQEINEQTHSIILASGTLSPLDSYSSELQTKFPVFVEANHVIDIKSQVFINIISTFQNILLDSSFKNQESLSYQNALSQSIITLSRLSPGDKPRSKAILFAVCRGKVSEGLNFSDNYARMVIVVGIPFPATHDKKVVLKKNNNNVNNKASLEGGCHFKGMSGEYWYKQQAFRAINQAIGRCIRHKNDFGSIVLLDPRYKSDAHILQLSKWVRSEINIYDKLEDIIIPTQGFFRRLLPLN
eukprot:gene12486-16749_t